MSDILHVLRSGHDDLRKIFGQLDGDSSGSDWVQTLGDAARALEVHIRLERDYLYPEITGLFGGVQVLISSGMATFAALERKLKSLGDMVFGPGPSQADQDEVMRLFSEVRRAALAHFDSEERSLLPKLRDFMKTEDREDLGQVMLDAKEDGMNQTLAFANHGGRDLPGLKRA